VDDVVLDIGAYLGDTPLLWLYKGARSVIAVEPVLLHFQYLKRNVAGLPVVCINASLAVELPYVPELEGDMGYGPFIKHRNINTSNKLNVPVVQLVDLVKDYRPTLVKLDCESCEHFVLEQLSQLPTLGVRKIAIEFHENDTYQFSEELLSFRKDINGDFKVWSLRKGVHMLYITVHTQ
jgi:FkbM family methyltransferase